MVPFDEIHRKVFQLLETELPSYLTYHSPQHTAYVLEKAVFIAQQDNVNKKDLFMIRMGALFHDIGFISHYKNHEELGCMISTDILKKYNFTKHEIDEVCGMIMATKIPQTPKTNNEKIVADADLEYLGTDLFKSVSQLLFHELHYLNAEIDEEAFRRIQINFMAKHTYHTDFCLQHREEQKQRHLDALKAGL